MDFAGRIRELAAQIPEQIKGISTEEATKTALVMPFIQALGYNVFDTREVTPELCADVGVKKGEKVDYAILKAGQPIMLFECKACSANLDEVHASQLYRYFSVTEARVGVLTNGITYRFFSDLEAPNKMDARPFLEVNLLNLEEVLLAELKKFSKSSFDLETVLANANELKYTREIRRLLAQEVNQPSEEFVRLFAGRVYQGRMTQQVREQFTEITKKAVQQFISERVSDRLKSALEREEAAVQVAPPRERAQPSEVSEVETTEDELRAYYIIQAILSETVDPQRVVMRDQKSYCAILLDDNNRKPICRLRFGPSQRQVGLFDPEKNESRQPIESLTDIYRFGQALKETAARYVG